MLPDPKHIVVVGAGLGGLRTAQQLRAAGHDGPITLIGDEDHLPYDRPPLSKQLLTGEWGPPKAALTDHDELNRLGVSCRLGVPATGLRGTTVQLADGRYIHGNAVVLATGLRARQLPGQPTNVHTLRTLDDSLALRDALAQASSLLIIGAGFVGAEVASAARAAGIDVTMTEALPAPFSHSLGQKGGSLCARLLSHNNVRLHRNTPVVDFVDAHTVTLGDGTFLSADVVLAGVGGTPDVAWLDGAGLDTGNGIPCDMTGRVSDGAGLWAVGDIAAWASSSQGGRKRTEHWTNATDQAAIVARDILGAPSPPASIPYFWSDQFGIKIQLVGTPEFADEVVTLHGDGLTRGAVKGTVLGYFQAEALVAVAGFSAAGTLARYRKLINTGADRADTFGLANTLAAR